MFASISVALSKACGIRAVALLHLRDSGPGHGHPEYPVPTWNRIAPFGQAARHTQCYGKVRSAAEFTGRHTLTYIGVSLAFPRTSTALTRRREPATARGLNRRPGPDTQGDVCPGPYGWKLRTKRGRERYARLMETVEPVFGQIKQGRDLGQFLLRGLEK